MFARVDTKRRVIVSDRLFWHLLRSNIEVVAHAHQLYLFGESVLFDNRLLLRHWLFI